MLEIVNEITFESWPKIHRLNREVIVTEKIDGTNAAIIITDDGQIAAQSRKRLITPDNDNFGFARWVDDNAAELIRTLGPGRHFGEWWGSGIQRGYGLEKGEKRFSLFNAIRWDANPAFGYRATAAPLCYVVPIIRELNGFDAVNGAANMLKRTGSWAAPGFQNPEGVVAYHKQGNVSFKVTCEKDEAHKNE